MEHAIRLRGFVKRFGAITAVDGLDLDVPFGTCVGLLGPNGAGKSTLLRVLATLLRPHAGAVRVLGAELPAEAWRVRGSVGYVGHDPLLYRQLSARENLRFQARLHRVRPTRVEEVLAAVGMERRADEPMQALSRGMAQRVAVARAVLHDPPLVLLDEPRAHLDPAAAALVEPLIGRTSGRTRVLVSHDLEGALAESDRALGLRAGRQAFFGPVAAPGRQRAGGSREAAEPAEAAPGEVVDAARARELFR